MVYTLFMLSEAAAAEAAPIVLSVTAERLIVAVFPSLEVGGETGGGGAVSSSPAPFNAEHSVKFGAGHYIVFPRLRDSHLTQPRKRSLYLHTCNGLEVDGCGAGALTLDKGWLHLDDHSTLDLKVKGLVNEMSHRFRVFRSKECA